MWPGFGLSRRRRNEMSIAPSCCFDFFLGPFMGERERVAPMELASIFLNAFYKHFAATRLAGCRKENALYEALHLATHLI